MAKTGYRFNPETLSYDKIHISFRKRLTTLLTKFFSSLSLALVIFFIVSAIVDSPKEKALKREKEEILAQYQILNNEVDRLDKVLKELESRDDNIYRVIFESEPIDASIRRAGSGGVNKYESLKGMDNAELIINTSRKLDELSKAIYIQSKSYDEVEHLAKNKIDSWPPSRQLYRSLCETRKCVFHPASATGCTLFTKPLNSMPVWILPQPQALRYTCRATEK